MSASSRLSYDNVIDADGHINEPPDLWENYLEPQYREGIPFGGCDAKERLELLDREGLAKAILYPTLSLE